MQLLIDENLSPRLARWACENGYPAEAAVHVGLAGSSDTSVFAQAFSRDQVVVTVNVGDFMALAAGMDVHPGVIALREAELNAQQQWLRLKAALDYAKQICGGDLLNQVLRFRPKTSSCSTPSRTEPHPVAQQLPPPQPRTTCSPGALCMTTPTASPHSTSAGHPHPRALDRGTPTRPLGLASASSGASRSGLRM